MLNFIRQVLKKAIRGRRQAPVRFFLWSMNAKRDQAATERFSEISGIPQLDLWESPVLDSDGGKVLFILGSGSSINGLTAAQFEHIRAHQSIGINFWYLHDFVPDVLSFDAGKPNRGQSNIRKTLETLGELLNRREILEFRPQLLYLRPLNLESKHVLPVPAELANNRWVSGRANFVSEDPQTLESDLRLVLRKISNRQIPSSVLPDNGASVVRMIFFGLAQGFKQFVLTGVDLDDRPHFWASNQYSSRYRKQVRLISGLGSESHGTAHAIERPLGNIEFLALLGKAMKEVGAGELWVSSSDSKLSPHLPGYSWPFPTLIDNQHM